MRFSSENDMSLSAKKWVWFDLDDTIHDFIGTASIATPKVLKLLSKHSGLAYQEIEENYRTVLKRHKAIEFADGRTSHEYRSERFLGALGYLSAPDEHTEQLIELALVEYETNYMNNLKLKPHVKDALVALQNSGLSLAILTDAPEDAQERVIQRLELEGFFSNILTSGGMHISKKKGLFSTALEHLDATPGQVVMVGDSIKSDIEPALVLGIDAIWFNDTSTVNNGNYRAITTHKDLYQEIGLCTAHK